MDNPLFKKQANRFSYPEELNMQGSMSGAYSDMYRGGVFGDGEKFPKSIRERIKKTVFGSVKIGQRRSSLKTATGEMSPSEVTRDNYPVHFAIADAVGGTVEPFDVYQGPYIQTPDGGRLFITMDEGGLSTVFNDVTTSESGKFYFYDPEGAVVAARSVLPKKTKAKGKPKQVVCDRCNRTYTQDPNGNNNGLCSNCSDYHDELTTPAPTEAPKPYKKLRKTPSFSEEDKIRLHGLGVTGAHLALWNQAIKTGALKFKGHRYHLAKQDNSELASIVAGVNKKLTRLHIPKNPKAHEAAIRRIARSIKNPSAPKIEIQAGIEQAEQAFTRFAKQAAKSTHILYDAGLESYTVRVMRGNDTIDEYNGGNSPYASTEVTPRTNSDAIEYKRLLEFAEQTAKEMAQEYGVPENMIDHDEDLMAEEREMAGMDFTSEDNDELRQMGIRPDADISEVEQRNDDEKKFDSKFLQNMRIQGARKLPENKKYSEDDINYLLDWFSNVWGSLKPDIRKRLIRVINHPTEKTWSDACSIILNGDSMKTLWRAVIAVDPSFPRKGPASDREGNIVEGWEKIPTQETLVKALLNVAGLNSMPTKPTLENPFSPEDKKIMERMGIITGASHRQWWPYGRHKFEPQEGNPMCKACKLPADHTLHTTPPPVKNDKTASGIRCPECGSTKYSLMPTDFETAKCDKCGKNWVIGIVRGINDPSDKVAFFSPEDAEIFRKENGGSNVALRDVDETEEEEEDDSRKWEPVFENGREANMKTANIYKVEKVSRPELGGDKGWYIIGLPQDSVMDGTKPDSFIIPGLHHALNTPESLTQGIYEQLYDEFQTNGNLKEGDIFDTPVGQFICQGIHVLPHDEKAKAAVAKVNEQYKCVSCGCDQGDHRQEYDDWGGVDYAECRNHPEQCKRFRKKGLD